MNTDNFEKNQLEFSLENQAKQRSKFQSEFIAASKNKKLVALEACTSSGKGRACFKFIQEDTSTKKWLILVPEILQVQNMKDDIVKHGFDTLYKKIEDIICYASFDKYKGKQLNIWCNEVHRFSELKYDISKTILFDKFLVDSATIPYSVKERLNEIGDFFYFKLSLKEAIERGILPEPNIYIIDIELDNISKRHKKTFGSKKIFLTDKEYNKYLDKDLEYWKYKLQENPDQQWIKNKMNSIGLIRKRFFSDVKTNHLKTLVEQLSNKRFICFCGSLNQADLLGGNCAIHSKKTKKHNLKTLEKFNNLEISQIYLYKMGREGLNLKNINCGIITQLSTGNDEGLEFLQSFGRSLRSETPEFYILCIKNTRDEVFLQKALNNVDKKYVKKYKLITNN